MILGSCGACRLGAMVLTLATVMAAPERAASAPLPSGLEDGGLGRVAEVIDGDTLVLDDGREVRLVGIQAPKLPLGRPGFTAWPLAAEAKEALEALVHGETVVLGYGGRRLDRHGRALAHMATGPEQEDNGKWVQGALLRQGLARVYTFADNRALAGEMLRIEALAREAGRGIWSHHHYAVREAVRVDNAVSSFQLVSGPVLRAADVRGRIYLNFGEDWKTDFTVTLDSRTRRLFEAEGIDPLGYRGKRVRVRGWIESFNGPMIEASHPEQIEVIEE